MQVAWAEDPKLAFQIAQRAASPQLLNQVRWYLLHHTEQCIDDADSLQILLDNKLPDDVTASQLKVCFQHALSVYIVADVASTCCTGIP